MSELLDGEGIVHGELFHVAGVDGLEEGFGTHPVQSHVGGPVVYQSTQLNFARGYLFAGVLECAYAPDTRQGQQRGDEQDGAKTQTQTGADAKVAKFHGDLGAQRVAEK